jgi:predicted DNA-binding ribbon-helix-helix protein
MQRSAIVKRSVRVMGHPTSISLEAPFWRGLCDIAATRGMSVNALVAAIDTTRGGNLSSAIRLFVLDAARKGEWAGDERAEGKRAGDEVASAAPGDTLGPSS